jgi:hypothetical protein
MSPPRRHTLMGLLASESCLCTTTRDIGFPGSASASAVSGSPSRLSFVHRPPLLAKRVHPPELSLPCRALPLRVRLTAAVSAKLLPGGSVPLRDINQKRPPDSGFPGPESVPSSAFRTPSTVSSAPGLAGLFHPAAASRVRSSGVFPPVKPCHLVGGRCPPAVTAGPLPGSCLPGSANRRPAYRALLLTGIRCSTVGV